MHPKPGFAIISAIVRETTKISLNLCCFRCETGQMLCGIPRYLWASKSPCLLNPNEAGKLLQYPTLIALVQETRSPRGQRCRARSGLPRLTGSPHLMAPGPASGGRPLTEDSQSARLPERPGSLGRPRASLHLWRLPRDPRAPSRSSLPARPDPPRSPGAASARTSTHPAGRTGSVRGGGGAKC